MRQRIVTLIQHLPLLLMAGCLLFSTQTSAETTSSSNKVTAEENFELGKKAYIKADLLDAMSYFRKAAEAGHGLAMARLGYLLDKSELNEEAIVWLKKSAALGNAEGQFELARMHAEGEGVKQDKKTALELFTQSANNKFTDAIRVLAMAYEEGGLDLRVDYELAQHWLNKGLLANDLWSINRLKEAYRKGDLGLRIDKQKAKQLEQKLEALKEQKDQ